MAEPARDLPDEVNVEGRLDVRNGVRFIGIARRMPDGTYQALADVHGALCLVQCRITRAQEPSHG